MTVRVLNGTVIAKSDDTVVVEANDEFAPEAVCHDDLGWRGSG